MGHHECRGDKDASDGAGRRLPFTDLHEDWCTLIDADTLSTLPTRESSDLFGMLSP
jgi:hypothetical protein